MHRGLSIGLVLAAALSIHCGAPPEGDEAAAPAVDDDPGTGTLIGDDTPTGVPTFDPCIDGDICLEPAEANTATSKLSGYITGAKLLVRMYAGFHKTADAKSAYIGGVDPNGGVPDDAVHLWGNPSGYIPPAQVVVLASPVKSNGFYEVTYDGKKGWISSSKLALVDSTKSPIDYALEPSLRNSFFKHQIHRTRWNKDGPSHSGNCAPTSLAMALRILGKEPKGLSVEESIHRVRLSYSTPVHDDNGPTSRLQIHQAAVKLGLTAKSLDSDGLTPSEGLTRIAGELKKKRLVVLEGQTGDGTGKPTTYQKAMNKAYAAAIADGQTLYHNTYTFDGYHSILVLGRDDKGDYIVGDPFSEVGFVALTSAEMKDFITRWSGHHGTGNSVYLP